MQAGVVPILDNLDSARERDNIADQGIPAHKGVIVDQVRERQIETVAFPDDGDCFRKAAAEHLIVDRLATLETVLDQELIHGRIGKVLGID